MLPQNRLTSATASRLVATGPRKFLAVAITASVRRDHRVGPGATCHVVWTGRRREGCFSPLGSGIAPLAKFVPTDLAIGGHRHRAAIGCGNLGAGNTIGSHAPSAPLAITIRRSFLHNCLQIIDAVEPPKLALHPCRRLLLYATGKNDTCVASAQAAGRVTRRAPREWWSFSYKGL